MSELTHPLISCQIKRRLKHIISHHLTTTFLMTLADTYRIIFFGGDYTFDGCLHGDVIYLRVAPIFLYLSVNL